MTYSDPFGLSSCKDDDETCRELVRQLESLNGDQFQRAAEAYRDYKGGYVHAVPTTEMPIAANGFFDRGGTGDVFINSDLEAGDFLMAAHHEALHLPTWLNLRNEYSNPAVREQMISNELRAFTQLGSLNWVAPFYHAKLKARGATRHRPLPPLP